MGPDLDPEVTAVGKASERARQLLFWTFQHPSLDNSPAIKYMWAVSRNIALAFLVLMIVGFGFQLILAKEKAKLQSMFPKLLGMVIFCVFSYVLVLGFIQLSEIIMKFFIENVVGKDLFNITFFGGGNIEENYTSFIGRRDTDPALLESFKTSLTVIKLTTLTYNTIFIMLVVRKIILWFLLVLAPFLPLLFTFQIIKNVGWIWIGVFGQWLFYGPLFSIFLATLVKIWESGIPFAFDFTRNCPQGFANCTPAIIFPTATNIFYGGPAQTLGYYNSSNYIDTYAEYLIGLLMLWVVTLLPWLLLRNFRDYCCEILKSLEAATMNLYSRLIKWTAPGPTGSGTGRVKVEMPFHRQIDKTRPSIVSTLEKEQLSKMKTEEILNTVGLRTAKLSDISRLEINTAERVAATQKLNYLKTPSAVSDISMRQQYSIFNQELSSRANQGDVVAERMLAADSRVPAEAMVQQSAYAICAPRRACRRQRCNRCARSSPSGSVSALSTYHAQQASQPLNGSGSHLRPRK